MNGRAQAHPGTSLYLIVAAFLALLTAMEVTVFYLRAVRPVLVPVLLILSGAKFVLVVMFYMHLRYDSRTLSAILTFALLIAAIVIVSLLLLMAAFMGGS